MSTLKHNLYRKPWYLFIWLLLLGSLGFASWLGFQVPLYIEKLYVSYESPEQYYEWWWLLGGIFFLEYGNRVFYQLLVNKFIQHLMQNIRTDSYALWMRSYERNGDGLKDEGFSLGEILARLISDTEAIKELLSSGSLTLIIDLFFIVSCFLGFFKLNVFIGAVFIGLEAGIVLLLFLGSHLMVKVYMDVRIAISTMSKALSDLIKGAAQSYHTRHGDYALKVSEVKSEDFLKKQLKANIWDAAYYSVTESLFPILLVFLALILPLSKVAELSIVAVLIDLLQRSIAPIKQIASKISNIQRAMTGIMRIDEFQSLLKKRKQRSKERSLERESLSRFTLKVDLFHYGNDSRNFSIKDFNFSSTKGKMIGVIGKSGSGKSSLLKIMTGELKPQSYEIQFQGEKRRFVLTPSQDEDFESYREQLSLVSQESHIFSDSLGFNISLGHENFPIQKFWDELREKIPYLKEWGIGLKDRVKPGELSLGQKQLISAIRSCFLSRPIVLWDEISSSLDARLELAVREVMKIIQEKSLLIIVAHRIETLVESDEILVMEKGRLVHRGNHQDLEENSSVYREFLSHLGRV